MALKTSDDGDASCQKQDGVALKMGLILLMLIFIFATHFEQTGRPFTIRYIIVGYLSQWEKCHLLFPGM